jgi:hypothetical protein
MPQDQRLRIESWNRLIAIDCNRTAIEPQWTPRAGQIAFNDFLWQFILLFHSTSAIDPIDCAWKVGTV